MVDRTVILFFVSVNFFILHSQVTTINENLEKIIAYQQRRK
jgi:hypothetical protein